MIMRMEGHEGLEGMVRDPDGRYVLYADHVAALARASSPDPVSASNEQITHMVDRFLCWKLPEDFNPDGGISFKNDFNENTPWPMKQKPVGTNLFDAMQAEEMVRNMIKDLPSRPDPAREALVGALEGYCAEHERHHCFLPYPHEKCPCELCKIATAALAEQGHKGAE